MFYEILLITFGIYLEQNYNLPSISLNLRRLQTQFSNNEQSENFFQDLFNSLLNKKK
jgi:hypothetical protein